MSNAHNTLHTGALYAISMSFGLSMDIQGNCHSFLEALRTNLSLDKAFLFWNEQTSNSFNLLSQVPLSARPNFLLSTDIIDKLNLNGVLSVNDNAPQAAILKEKLNLSKGHFLCFHCEHGGLLILHRINKVFLQEEQQAINPITVSFGNYIASLMENESLQKNKHLEEKRDLKLKIELKKYKSIFENSKEAIIYHDIVSNRPIDCNSKALELFKVDSKDEFLKRLHTDFQADPKEADFLFFQQLVKEAYKKGKISFSRILKNAKGETFRAKGIALKEDTNPKAPKIIFFLNDVTEKHKAKQEKNKLINELNQIIDSIPAGFLFKDDKNNILKCNETFSKTAEVENQEELIGKNIADIIGKADAALIYQDDLDIIQSGEAKMGVIEKVLMPSGKRKWMRSDKTPYKDENGVNSGVLIYSIDVTDMMESQRKTEERKAIYYTLLEKGFDGVEVTKKLEKGNLITKERNDKLRQLFGRSDEELGNLNWLNLSPEFQPNGLSSKDYFKKLQKQSADRPNKLINAEWRFLNKSGIPFDVNLTSTEIEINDVSYTISIFKEITEAKKQQALIRRQMSILNKRNAELQKYIESNFQLENFAYMASHDLKTPIRSIISFTQLLQRSIKEKLNESEQEYMDFILKASKNMQQLIDALLTYSKINTSELEITDIDPEMIIERTLFDLTVSIQEKSAAIELKNLPKNIRADKIKIQQLLQNLISNSLKFTKTNQKASITINCEDQKDHWCFSIQDNGIGIAEEYQEKIFLIFRRLHGDSEYEGTGIGLAICKKIVEQHQGDIWLESKEGEGTTFYFTIQKVL